MFRKLTRSIVFLLLLVISVAVLSAQSVATLTNGTPALVRLSADAPLTILTFSGNTGDLVQINIIGLAPQLSPRVSLQSPTQQALTSSLLNADGNSASLSYLLTESGAHSLLIGGEAGDYLVSLSSINTADAFALPYSAEQEVTLGAMRQVATVNVPADGRATVGINAGQFRDYIINAFDETGKHIATLSNSSYACLVVTPQSTLVFASTHIDVEGSVVITVGADCGTSTSPASSPAVSVPVSPPQTGSSACVVTNGGAVNVRNGAGTNYGTIGQLAAGSTTPVIGRANAEWVQVQSPFGVGFVSTTVATLSGNCNNLPTVSGGGQAPVQPTQPVPTVDQPTQPPAQPDQPTQPPDQPTQPPVQPTQPPVQPTLAPTEAPTQQVAPPDGNYTANIDLDGSTVLSDYVSYPDGDTEDIIFYRVERINPSVALPGGQATFTAVLTCSGEGSQYIEMEAPGRGITRCGEVFTRNVTFDSNNGQLRIRATGGDATYVRWTLNVTAPRK